jgi:hypothetical protein
LNAALSASGAAANLDDAIAERSGILRHRPARPRTAEQPARAPINKKGKRRGVSRPPVISERYIYSLNGGDAR